MPNPFEVVVDNSGRISHFVPASYPGEQIGPEAIGGYLDGDERVALRGSEYALTGSGNLIHPDVEVNGSVILGFGVRLDEGTSFSDMAEQQDFTVIEDRTRISGTTLGEGVSVGHHAFILGQYVGDHTVIGPYVRISTGTAVAAEVKIGATTKIDVDSQISDHAEIGENVRLGFNTRVGRGAIIGNRSRIGLFTGAGPRGDDKGGVLIRDGAFILPSTHLHD